MERKNKLVLFLLIVLVMAVALAAGNVYFLTRQEKAAYWISVEYPVSGWGLTTTVKLDQEETQAVLLGLFMADSAAEAELPQRDPDGVVKFTESQYGATNQIAQVWLEGDDVWLKTPDQACKRVRDADDEMRQVLQKQSEEVKQLQKG